MQVENKSMLKLGTSMRFSKEWYLQEHKATNRWTDQTNLKTLQTTKKWISNFQKNHPFKMMNKQFHTLLREIKENFINLNKQFPRTMVSVPASTSFQTNVHMFQARSIGHNNWVFLSCKRPWGASRPFLITMLNHYLKLKE